MIGDSHEEEGEIPDAQTSDTLACVLVQRAIDQLALLLLQSHDAVFDSILDQDTMNLDLPTLADAVCAVNRLLLNVRIPEGVQQDDVVGCCEVAAP